MARFNLNQILSDASKAAASGGEPIPRPAESRFEQISAFDLVPSEDNFYSMREIDELKAAIEIAGKVLQNLVVVPLADGKYKVISGHRRRLASILPWCRTENRISSLRRATWSRTKKRRKIRKYATALC